MPSPAALALALVVSATGARLEAGVSGEARTRHTDPTSVQGADSLTDVSILPVVTGQLLFPLSTLTAAYDPRVTWYDLGGGEAHPVRLEVLQQARLHYQLDPDPVWSVGVGATGALGRVDLVTLNQSQGGTGQPRPPSTVPTTETIDYRRLYGDLDLRWAPERRSVWTVGATVGTDGGSTPLARETMPTQDLLTARLSYGWSATRQDVVGFRAAGTGSLLPGTDTRSAFATGLATWRHQATPSTSINAGAGLAWLFAETLSPTPPPPKTTKERRRPAAELGISYAPPPRGPAGGGPGGGAPADDAAAAGASTPGASTGGTSTPGASAAGASAAGESAAPTGGAAARGRVAGGFTGSATVSLGAAIDRVTGAVSQELAAGLEGRWRVSEPLTLGARASGALDRYDPTLGTAGGDTRRGMLEIRGDWAFTARTRAYLGAYASWQAPLPGTAPPFTEYGGFLGVGFDAPALVR